MMIDTNTGACAAPTSHAKFSNIELSNSKIRLNSSGNLLDAEVKQFDLYAVNGVFGDEENHLEGSVVINDTPVVVPLDTAGHILNPDYHPIAFVDTFDCKPDTIIPQTEDDCSFRSVLAQGAARICRVCRAGQWQFLHQALYPCSDAAAVRAGGANRRAS